MKGRIGGREHRTHFLSLLIREIRQWDDSLREKQGQGRIAKTRRQVRFKGEEPVERGRWEIQAK